jgi:DNA adenine methylase
MIAYIGGKFRMAEWISSYIPKDIETYAEIFGGAFWVYLKSDIYTYPNLKNVVYNDFNRFMVNMFECSRNYTAFHQKIVADGVVSQNKDLFEEFKKEVLELEKTGCIKNIIIPDYRLAYKYPYVLTQVFSGVGIKENSKMMDLGGKYVSKFDSFVKRLSNETFQTKLDKITECTNLDFEDAVKKLDNETAFLYFDPPYYNTENYYSFHEFGLKDHERLANVLKNMKGRFALSYYVFDDLIKWFPEDKYRWIRKEFNKNSAAKKGVKQNKGEEILIFNY